MSRKYEFVCKAEHHYLNEEVAVCDYGIRSFLGDTQLGWICLPSTHANVILNRLKTLSARALSVTPLLAPASDKNYRNRKRGRLLLTYVMGPIIGSPTMDAVIQCRFPSNGWRNGILSNAHGNVFLSEEEMGAVMGYSAKDARIASVMGSHAISSDKGGHANGNPSPALPLRCDAGLRKKSFNGPGNLGIKNMSYLVSGTLNLVVGRTDDLGGQ